MPPVFLVALVVVSGCLFEPRDPEPPSSGQSIPYLPRGEARNVWTNLQTALNHSDSFGWEESISPDFRYYPDTDAENEFPGLFADWDYEKESTFINRFFDSGVKIVADLMDDDFNVPDAAGTEVEWVGVVYFLDVTTTSDNSNTRYSASARITFRLEANFWYIYEWTDQQKQSDPDNEGQLLSSMGVLRGSFGSK